LESAIKSGYEEYYNMQWEPTLRPVKEKNDERWGALMKKCFIKYIEKSK
jgi:hypothetical protein